VAGRRVVFDHKMGIDRIGGEEFVHSFVLGMDREWIHGFWKIQMSQDPVFNMPTILLEERVRGLSVLECLHTTKHSKYSGCGLDSWWRA